MSRGSAAVAGNGVDVAAAGRDACAPRTARSERTASRAARSRAAKLETGRPGSADRAVEPGWVSPAARSLSPVAAPAESGRRPRRSARLRPRRSQLDGSLHAGGGLPSGAPGQPRLRGGPGAALRARWAEPKRCGRPGRGAGSVGKTTQSGQLRAGRLKRTTHVQHTLPRCARAHARSRTLARTSLRVASRTRPAQPEAMLPTPTPIPPRPLSSARARALVRAFCIGHPAALTGSLSRAQPRDQRARSLARSQAGAAGSIGRRPRRSPRLRPVRDERYGTLAVCLVLNCPCRVRQATSTISTPTTPPLATGPTSLRPRPGSRRPAGTATALRRLGGCSMCTAARAATVCGARAHAANVRVAWPRCEVCISVFPLARPWPTPPLHARARARFSRRERERERDSRQALGADWPTDGAGGHNRSARTVSLSRARTNDAPRGRRRAVWGPARLRPRQPELDGPLCAPLRGAPQPPGRPGLCGGRRRALRARRLLGHKLHRYAPAPRAILGVETGRPGRAGPGRAGPGRAGAECPLGVRAGSLPDMCGAIRPEFSSAVAIATIPRSVVVMPQARS